MEKFSRMVCGRLFSFIPIQLGDEISFSVCLGWFRFKMSVVDDRFKIVNGNVPLGIKALEDELSGAIFSKDM